MPSSDVSSYPIGSVFGLLCGCLLFGLGSVIVAHVVVGSFAMAFWRLLISSALFCLFAFLFHQPFPKTKKARLFALCSGMVLGLDLALWHESVHAVGPGISTLLNGLQIFFLTAIGFFFFGERQGKAQLASLCLAIIGVALIASPEFSYNRNATWGFVSGIISGALLAVSMVFIRQTHTIEKVAILPMMTLVGVGGGMALLPLTLWLDMGYILPKSLPDLGWIIVYALVMQCLAWGLIAYCIPRLSLSLTGLLLLSEPVGALAIDYFWLDKVISISQWVGATITMTAIYLGSMLKTQVAK